MTTRYRLFATSRSGDSHNIVPAELLADAVARARAAHAERTGDAPDAIHVTTRDALHPAWTPVLSDMERDYNHVRQS